jgi:hypothetical protein
VLSFPKYERIPNSINSMTELGPVKASPAPVRPELPGRVTDPARAKNIERAVSAITKLCGEGSIRRPGGAMRTVVDAISTGLLAIGLVAGVGGLPRGRIIEMKLAPRVHNRMPRCAGMA